ncbi:DNA polymerase zeta catalytic subunit [Nannizzia gypsea CBS 118893]|uniref:DNA polymerase n=1 Tax=Arthroderma gypseum (strain ATCC MYA-4604 / CBS 118893) TaxID=535722 RepID=E4UWB6_ARTGP|nr:DNA polymerase zeta catalytic subunit [Nannizzia gypsea CBS 118893]EFR02511.1 DNA polymerase zeta catalytic subunit [Nannizzia gypsea CBS 118893]
MPAFRVLLNCVDHYQATPTELDPQFISNDNESELRSRSIKVPVIRVFGATETGQKVCAHIHGALPYLYLEYKGDLNPAEVNTAIRTLHASIDHALALSYRRNPLDHSTAFVAYISLVKGIPFYGYHVGYRYYFKVYLLNPLHMTRLSDVLMQGAVMKRVLQPYESHLQFIPQWMCDYNLHGCAYINCSKIKFRPPVPSYINLESSDHLWHDESIPQQHISDPDKFPRQSHCAIEVDIHVQDILNRHEVKQREIHHDFVVEADQGLLTEKLVPSLRVLWKDEERRRKSKLGLNGSEGTPFSQKDLASMSSNPRQSYSEGWIHEREFREQIDAIVTEERRKRDSSPLSSDFVHHPEFHELVKTALESVQELYPENVSGSHADAIQSQISMDAHIGNVEVDETRIDSFGLDTIFDNGDMDDPISQDYQESETMVGRELAPDTRQVGRGETLNSEIFLQPSQLEEFGIRRVSDSINSDCDMFDIDSEFLSLMNSKLRKRDRNEESSPEEYREKKIKVTAKPHTGSSPKRVQPQTLMSRSRAQGTMEEITDISTSDPPISSQKSRVSGGDNQRLPFLVVKDPTNPATVLRLSQQNQQSRKAQRTLEKECFLPGGSTSQTNKIISSNEGEVEPSTIQSQDNLQNITSYQLPKGCKVYCFLPQCPLPSFIRNTISEECRPSVIYQEAYYSNDTDVPERAREYAGKEFKLESNTLPFLPTYDPTGISPAMLGEKPPLLLDRTTFEEENKKLRRTCSLRTWEFAAKPPIPADVIDWFKHDKIQKNCLKNSSADTTARGLPISQIDAPTQHNKHGFKYSQRDKSSTIQHEANYMSVMSLEVHVNTRGTLAPNPEEDEVACIFWSIASEEEGRHRGIVALSETSNLSSKFKCELGVEFQEETSELEVINRIIGIVRYYDPDILTGYEVHNGSWGYLIERARRGYDYDLCDEFSRVKSQSHGRIGRETDRWGFNHTSTIRVTGRHMINIWRAMRGELNLLQYTMENVVFHLLHKRIPHYPFEDLTRWFKSDRPRDVAKTIRYFSLRVDLNLEILDANELIPRTSEQARILGIDFYSVFSRGSQFKVESLMFRIAKPENFVLISPRRKQVGQQNALECLPLVMEPQSDFYTSPLLVLDFQSLYPSIMIAYNYCYSTNLGRIVNWRGRNKMGITDYEREPGLLGLLKDKVNIAPNGIIYAKQEVRKSLLAKMLTEILETRVMVKNGMKEDKDDRPLQRLLNNRQLALKLIANVTYGYTSASFSGRMPCSEIADSIVQTARETLEKAIALIHSVKRWGAEVVYGDTDSLFIYLKGRTREEAFDLGEEIAKTITDSNPRPVKLKFEKVYHPCILLAKKRYVGYKYESRNQQKPEFDAKGIETVRRDGTPAEQKIEEKALRLLFETSDLSRVKEYFQKQCSKIMRGKVSIQDFCFAKEVRLGTYSDKGAPPPGALISAKRMLEDPRLEPQYGERVPYVVVSGAPGARLIDRCFPPDVLLQDSQLELDAEYYISKNLIPPLERIFNLVGANVRQWYDEMPKYQRMRRTEGAMNAPAGRPGQDGNATMFKKTLECYMKSSSCAICRSKLNTEEQRQQNQQPICNVCLRQQPHLSLLKLEYRMHESERRVANLQDVCRSCMGVGWGEEIKCDSKDCPVFYARTRQTSDLRHTRALLQPIINALNEATNDDDEPDEHEPLNW